MATIYTNSPEIAEWFKALPLEKKLELLNLECKRVVADVSPEILKDYYEEYRGNRDDYYNVIISVTYVPRCEDIVLFSDEDIPK